MNYLPNAFTPDQLLGVAVLILILIVWIVILQESYARPRLPPQELDWQQEDVPVLTDQVPDPKSIKFMKSNP